MKFNDFMNIAEHTIKQNMKEKRLTDNLKNAKTYLSDFISNLDKCNVSVKYRDGEIHLLDTESKKKIIIKE